MSKEYLEALEKIGAEKLARGELVRNDSNIEPYYNILKQALNELQSIKEANPSEALKDLEILKSHISARDMLSETNKKIALDICNDVKQALLKAQEQEKEKLFFKNIHNTKVKTPLVTIFEGLSKDERFKFTEHIYYHWEEMKEALEEKNNELEKENARSEKILQKYYQEGITLDSVRALNLRIQALEKDLEEQRELAKHYLEEQEKEIAELRQKAQEPKQYLKWEDLKFDEDGQETLVLLNGTKYRMYYYKGYDERINLFTEDETSVIHMFEGCYSQDKQFFNDLHLERVEE